jgi:flagella basal body P-ring formation protein FlgA
MIRILWKLAFVIFLGSFMTLWGQEPKESQVSVEQKLKNHLENEFNHKGRIEVERVFVKGVVPEQAQIIFVEPKPAVGWISFELVWDNEGKPQRAYGTGMVKLYAPIAVAKTVIKPHEAFTKDNVALEEREVSAYKVTWIYDDLSTIFKLRSRSYLNPGAVISHNATQIPFLVNLGETVALVRETPSVRVSMRVKALENGRENQWIRVENVASRKTLQARVIQPGEVSLH